MKKIILLSLLLISSATLWAQTVPPSNLTYLDTTFNRTGTIKGQKLVNSLVGEARALVLDNLGRIVVAACSTNQNPFINVFRLKADGTLDASFGSVTADTVKINLISFGTTTLVTSLAMQKDGKILIGGSMNNTASMLVIRLNSNGSRDTTFDKDGVRLIDVVAGAPDQVSDIAVQSDGKIILSGTSAGKIVVRRLNKDGSDDASFVKYISSNTAETAAGLEIMNDTIILGGSYSVGTSAPTYYYSVIKIAPNGGAGIWRKDLPFTSSSLAYAGDVAVQTDGKIIIGGNDYNGFRAYRLNPDGSVDNSFNFTGVFLYSTNMFGATMKSIVLEKNGKINLVGLYNYNYVLVRTDKSGTLDNTFGLSGELRIGTGYYPSTCKSVLSPDQKLLIAGAYSSTAEVLKVELNSLVHIIGNGYAQPGGVEKYTIQIPPSWGAVTYQWSYSGLYFDYVPGTTGYPIKLLFSDTATSGKLTCKITSVATGVILGAGEIDIAINPKPSNANQLAAIDCQTRLAKCAAGYIDNFALNTLNNSGSGCSLNGYTDYTQSNFTDTLVAGGVYAATLKIPNDGSFTNYVGIWIDYNNDGNFSNIDEFVGEGFSNESKIKVDIFLKNREGYDGPKRIRVRSRPDVRITSTESCPANGEEGEIEDYLIVLSKQPTLEAPQIITPNEDGLNDYFVIRGADPNKENKLTIFDRIGAVKYSSANYENDWNGVGKDGNKLSPGTYYYVVSTGKTSIKGFLEIRY